MNYENEMEISFRSVPVNEMLARNAVAAFILYLDPEVEELAEIKTAVSEAVTNCIVHGYEENPKGIITLECKISYDRKLYIKVADKGRGIENIDKVVTVDQAPIGKSPRSNPATYTNVFANIRNLFAEFRQ